MNQVIHSDDERIIVSIWVVDEVRKAVAMGCGVMDVFEFWGYEVKWFVKNTNIGDLFAQYGYMFLKLKQEPSGYPSWVKSEKGKDIYIEDYRRQG